MSMKNPMTPVGIEPATFRLVAQHLNYCATAGRPKYLRIFDTDIQSHTIPSSKQRLGYSTRYKEYEVFLHLNNNNKRTQCSVSTATPSVPILSTELDVVQQYKDKSSLLSLYGKNGYVNASHLYIQ